MSEPAAIVDLDLDGRTHRVGRLWVTASRGRESATFEYDESWLENGERFALEPALELYPGPFHTRAGQPMFGALGDSAPDRWGRTLIARAERRRARAEGRQPRALREIDYLLAVNDEVRQGALRFALHPGGSGSHGVARAGARRGGSLRHWVGRGRRDRQRRRTSREHMARGGVHLRRGQACDRANGDGVRARGLGTGLVDMSAALPAPARHPLEKMRPRS